ncbi:HAD family hydrolase [Motilimonas sp. 1_MG-2023]|uniref:HAD family hydrolase n=1 Tax=Motilimonas sp. 1_MG-2023 TaxID=3062672 RepID=UPI0026E2C87E|nr:HAD family hydrolase [Motilimonas sp. 1_MG-2023]MDO6525593.1 HAD family hydrolase [Motilimonas sp. 1_MG-2023]
MLLIFDLDNTLIDRDSAFQQCLTELFTTLGITLDESQWQGMLQQDNSGRTPRAEFCQYLMDTFPDLPQQYEQLWRYFEMLPQYIQPDSSLQSLLASLGQRHSLHLLTNGSSLMQREKIAQAQLAPYFSKIFVSAEVGLHKPDPEVFRQCMAGFHARDCVMIGDDFARDMIPAKKLGMKTVWVNAAGQGESDIVDYHLSHVLQLAEVFK